MKTKILLVFALLLAGISCKKDTPASPYPKAGLISYFGFNDTVADKQNYATMGTAKFSYVTGISGKAVHFNGVDEALEFIPTDPVVNTKISLSFWYKTAEAGNTKYFISGNGFRFATALGSIAFVISVPKIVNAHSNALEPNKWTHVVGTYDGTNMHIYINGAWVASKNNPSSTADFNSSLIFGVDQASYWAGSIDELYIYNRALSQAEVTQLYNMK
jgi:hypothetical protein